MKTLKQAILLALLLVSSSSFAAESPSTGQVIADLYDGFVAPIASFGGAVTAGGLGLIASLTLIHVVMGGLLYATGSKEPLELVIDAIKLSFTASLLIALIKPQAWLESLTGYSGSGVSMIEAGFRKLISMAGLTSDGHGFLKTITDQLFSAIFTLLKVPIVEGLGWTEILIAIPAIILSLVFLLVTLIMLLLAAALVLGEALGADLMLKYAVAFTPLLLPWAMARPLSFLAGAWIRTVLISGVGLVVAALFAKGMQSFIGTAANSLGKIEPGFAVSYSNTLTHFMPLTLGALIIVLLASKISSIASGLITGGGLDGVSLQAIRSSMAGASAMSSAPGKAGGQIASGASKLKTGAQQGAAGAKSSIQGFKGGLHAARTDAAKAAASRSGPNSPLQSAKDAASAVSSSAKGAAEGFAAGAKSVTDGKAASASARNERIQSAADQIRGVAKPDPAPAPPNNNHRSGRDVPAAFKGVM